MSSKKSFVEYLKAFVEHVRASVTTEEWVLGPAYPGPGRDVILVDKNGYESGEYGEQEDCYEEQEDEYGEQEDGCSSYPGYEEHPGYCREAVVLRGVPADLAEEAYAFRDACRDAFWICDCDHSLVWKSRYDFECDIKRFLEAK